MNNIKLARVDDRLIHGQVVTNWLQYTSAKQIIIIDDGTANDPFTSRIIRLSAPKRATLEIYTVEEAKEKLAENPSVPTLLLAKSPRVYLELIRAGAPIEEVNLGGMGSNPNRTKFYKNISAGPQEREDMQAILDEGVPISVQIIPNDNAVKVDESLINN